MNIGWGDAVVVIVVVVFIATRFFKFELPRDTRTPEQKQASNDWRRLVSRTVAPAQPAAESPEHTDEDAKPKRRVRDGQPKAGKTPLPPLRPLRKAKLEGLSGLEQIHALDPSFDDGKVLAEAKRMYGAFYKAWNGADETALGKLCAPTLLNRLLNRLDDYAERGKPVPQVAVDKAHLEADLVEGRVNGRTAVVTVAFTHGSGHSRWVLARAMASEQVGWEIQSLTGVAGE